MMGSVGAGVLLVLAMFSTVVSAQIIQPDEIQNPVKVNTRSYLFNNFLIDKFYNKISFVTNGIFKDIFVFIFIIFYLLLGGWGAP